MLTDRVQKSSYPSPDLRPEVAITPPFFFCFLLPERQRCSAMTSEDPLSETRGTCQSPKFFTLFFQNGIVGRPESTLDKRSDSPGRSTGFMPKGLSEPPRISHSERGLLATPVSREAPPDGPSTGSSRGIVRARAGPPGFLPNREPASPAGGRDSDLAAGHLSHRRSSGRDRACGS